MEAAGVFTLLLLSPVGRKPSPSGRSFGVDGIGLVCGIQGDESYSCPKACLPRSTSVDWRGRRTTSNRTLPKVIF
jgi:hypothetical protein